MKLPNWFKILWWVALVWVITFFLYKRYPDLIVGHATGVDVFAFAIWVALLLVPIFSEMSFLGIKLKQEVEEFKRALSLLRPTAAWGGKRTDERPLNRLY